jgi:hypothetical protein
MSTNIPGREVPFPPSFQVPDSRGQRTDEERQPVESCKTDRRNNRVRRALFRFQNMRTKRLDRWTNACILSRPTTRGHRPELECEDVASVGYCYVRR